MNPIRHILSRAAVLTVQFTAPDACVLTLRRLRRSGGALAVESSDEVAPDKLEALKLREPVLVLFSGHGVVSRMLPAPEIVARVTADPETFAWTEDTAGGRFSFARRDQVDPLLERLAGIGVVPVRTEYAAGGDEAQAVAMADRFYARQLRPKYLLRPSTESSRLLTLLCRRLRLPVLGAVLAVLVANTLAYDSLKERYAAQRAVIAAREKEQGASRTRSAEREAAAAEFSQRLPWRYAVLMDRIGGLVPDGLVLREMAVQPLKKKIEAGNAVLTEGNTVLIRGAAEASEDISAFAGRLRDEPFVRELRLKGIEQERDSGLWTFEIMIAL